jgi:hypothetical protein
MMLRAPNFWRAEWSIGRVLVTISDVLWRNVAASVQRARRHALSRQQ